MTCKRKGAITVAWYLLAIVRYSVRLHLQRRFNSKRKSFEIVSAGHDGKRCAAPWVELLRLVSESHSLSSERRHTHGTQKMNSWRFPGQVMTASPTTIWAGCIFFASSSMSQGCTTTYRLTTCTTATRLSLVIWHVWRFLVRYNNQRRHCPVDQNDTSSFPLSPTSYRRTAMKLGTKALPGLKNTLVQKKVRNLSPPEMTCTLLIGPHLP